MRVFLGQLEYDRQLIAPEQEEPAGMFDKQPCDVPAAPLAGSEREGGRGRVDLYRTRHVNGKYLAPENLGATINTARTMPTPTSRPTRVT